VQKAASALYYIIKRKHPMIQDTTNARILHATLDKLRELKTLLGFKTISEAAEFIINKEYTSVLVTQIRENQKQIRANEKQQRELLKKALGK
jgi:CO dehydrogenase/acetyl-CoA synthase gamma subunit (corrinoid Fe-S protein)